MIIRVATPKETGIVECETASYRGVIVKRQEREVDEDYGWGNWSTRADGSKYVSELVVEGGENVEYGGWTGGRPTVYPWEDVAGRELWRVDDDLLIADNVKVLAVDGWVPIVEEATDMPEGELIELAWGVIANAYDGDWTKASEKWRGAAERWRERWHEWRSR